MVSETDLYAPVKSLLEGKGYEVKAEVNGCDVVARKADAATVIVELKLTLSLELVLQGINRQNITDDIYIAIQAPDTAGKRRNWRSRQRGYRKLCRMLGLGLILVHLDRKSGPLAEVLLDPAPYTPRKNKRQQTRLIKEFERRAGDPNTGGANRVKIITSYRQDALRCAEMLKAAGETKVAEIRAATGVEKAATILQNNHYGWFERTARGIYRLSALGEEGLREYGDVVLSMHEDQQQ